jgi:vacuolar-type H+-ATPase subunit E/Vma4
MALEHLLAALEREANAQAAALLAAARAEAAGIGRDADEAVARRRSDVLAIREAELRGAAEAAVGEARRAGRATALQALERLLDRVLGAARAMFPAALVSDAYRAALPAHVAEALHALGDEPAVIRCPKALVPAVRAAARSRKHVTVRGDPTARPGVSVATADGVIEVDNTLDGRLERLRPRLSLEVVARVERGA